MRVVKQTEKKLVLADSEVIHTAIMFLAGLLVLVGFGGLWAREIGAILLGGVGLGLVLRHKNRRCLFDRHRGSVTIEGLGILGTRTEAFELTTVTGVRLVRGEDTESIWYDITLVFGDGGARVIGNCSDQFDGWGSEKNLRQSLASFGLEIADPTPPAPAT